MEQVQPWRQPPRRCAAGDASLHDRRGGVRRLYDPRGDGHPPWGRPRALSPGDLSRTAAAARPLARGIRPPPWPSSALMGYWAIHNWPQLSATGRTATHLGIPSLDLGSGRDGRVASAPDVWAPDRRRCHAAARLTRSAAHAAAPIRRRATADRPGGLGSATGPRLLAVPAAQPRGLADVCPLYSARRPERPSPGIRPQLGDGGPRITPAASFRPSLSWSIGISSTSPRMGPSSVVPRLHVRRSLCRRGAHNDFVPRAAGAQQPVCGPRPHAGRAAARVVLTKCFQRESKGSVVHRRVEAHGLNRRAYGDAAESS